MRVAGPIARKNREIVAAHELNAKLEFRL